MCGVFSLQPQQTGPGKQAPASGHTTVARPGTTGAGPSGRGWPAGVKGLQMLVLGGRARGEWASPCSPHGPHSGFCWGCQRQRSPTSGSWRAPCPAWRHFLPASSFLETRGVGVASPAPKDKWATRMELVSRTCLPGARWPGRGAAPQKSPWQVSSTATGLRGPSEVAEAPGTR